MKTAVVLLRELHHFHALDAFFKGHLESYEKVFLLIECEDTSRIYHEDGRCDKRFRKIYFKRWVFSDLLLNRQYLNAYKKKCKDIIQDSTRVDFFSFYYSSDPALLGLSMFQSKSFFLFDEGGASIEIASARGKIRLKDVVKRSIKSLLLLRQLKIPHSVQFITRFQICPNCNDGLILVSNKRKTLSNYKCNDLVWVIGTSAVALGIICPKFYLGVLMRLRERHKNNICTYIPHRKEDPADLKMLKSIGFLIQSHSQPIEVIYEKSDKQPNVIYSVATSCALFELWYKYKGLPIMLYIDVPRLYYFNDYIAYTKIVAAYSANGNIPVIDV